jgi:hypothetical protein
MGKEFLIIQSRGCNLPSECQFLTYVMINDRSQAFNVISKYGRKNYWRSM